MCIVYTYIHTYIHVHMDVGIWTVGASCSCAVSSITATHLTVWWWNPPHLQMLSFCLHNIILRALAFCEHLCHSCLNTQIQIQQQRASASFHILGSGTPPECRDCRDKDACDHWSTKRQHFMFVGNNGSFDNMMIVKKVVSSNKNILLLKLWHQRKISSHLIQLLMMISKWGSSYSFEKIIVFPFLWGTFCPFYFV